MNSLCDDVLNLCEKGKFKAGDPVMAIFNKTTTVVANFMKVNPDGTGTVKIKAKGVGDLEKAGLKKGGKITVPLSDITSVNL